jgi:biopolymer transport protein ExbB
MFADFDWLKEMATSPAFLILVGCSILTLGITIERVLYFAKRRGDPDGTLRRALSEAGRGDYRDAARTCESSAHPFGPVAAQLFRDGAFVEQGAEERMQIELSEQKMLLEHNVGVLGTMAGIAPLIGLLGTVWGIMRAFHDMAQVGSAAPSIVAAGIAEALFTTAAGILIAVPSVVLYNHFSRRLGTMLTVAENHARSLRAYLIETRSSDRAPSSSSGPYRGEPHTSSPMTGRRNPEPAPTR